MGSLSGKVVLVTGAGRGIGRAAALALSSHGARVAVNDVTPVNLDETVDLIRQAGGQVQDYVDEIARKMPVQAMVEQILADFGRIDILVNCTAVVRRVALLDLDEWDWHRTIDVNLGGVFLMMQVVGRIMRQQGAGEIINIAASGAGEGAAAFLASQAGVLALTQAAARELSSDGVRVNAICLPEQEQKPGFSPESIEIAVEIILALSCQAGDDQTGQVILVDGLHR
jgi:NAD(P)-dependent dehydrogenase (short-subunit alcohol dehydrogenase family)